MKYDLLIDAADRYSEKDTELAGELNNKIEQKMFWIVCMDVAPSSEPTLRRIFWINKHGHWDINRDNAFQFDSPYSAVDYLKVILNRYPQIADEDIENIRIMKDDGLLAHVELPIEFEEALG